jgi:hypothetical protein
MVSRVFRNPCAPRLRNSCGLGLPNHRCLQGLEELGGGLTPGLRPGLEDFRPFGA